MKKTLSVIIPTYNVELFLARCLDSLIYNEDIISDIDVIIVNDGSTDNSTKIAKKYCKKYPKSFRLINKKNGGHGSTINVGVREAQGKYIKILDSDDWFNIIDLPIFIKRLKTEVADIVVTNYRQELVPKNKEIYFKFNSQGYDNIQPIEKTQELVNEPEFFFQFSMHAMAIKRECLMDIWGEGLFENTFYVDQQFVAKVLACATSYIVYNLDIYRYFIGRAGQSVDVEGYFKHRHNHEKVLRWLLGTLKESDNDVYKNILKKQILLMIVTHYNIYIHYPTLTRKQKSEIYRFNKFLKNEYPEIYQQSRTAQRLHYRLSPVAHNSTVYLLATILKNAKKGDDE